MEIPSEKMEGKIKVYVKKIHLTYLQIDFQNYNISVLWWLIIISQHMFIMSSMIRTK